MMCTCSLVDVILCNAHQCLIYFFFFLTYAGDISSAWDDKNVGGDIEEVRTIIAVLTGPGT